MTTIRNLVKGEPLPKELQTGYENGNCDPDWIWVAEHDGKLVAILVTAPMHIVVMMIRLVATEEAGLAVRSLLLHFIKTIKERGFNGYYTMVDPGTDAGAALQRIVEGTGGMTIPSPQYVCVGAV